MKVLFCCDDTRPEPWLKGLHDALPGAEIAIWEPGAAQADYALVWAPPQQFLDEHYLPFCKAAVRAMFTYGFVPWRTRRLASTNHGSRARSRS